MLTKAAHASVRPGHDLVLVVDDDAAQRSAVAQGLSVHGFDVACAADGVDAFTWIEKNGMPDAVLLDLSMPGMNGWAFLEVLRADLRLERIPVVVVTASAAARTPDADAFLVKPIRLNELVEVVEDEIAAAKDDPSADVTFVRA